MLSIPSTSTGKALKQSESSARRKNQDEDKAPIPGELVKMAVSEHGD